MGTQGHYYTIIPDEISYATYPCGPHQGCRLKPSERVLLARIVNNYRYGHTDETNEELADYVGVTLRQVKTILKKLVDGGFVTIKGKTARRNLYPSDDTWKIWCRCLNSSRENNCLNLGQKNTPIREDFRKPTNIEKNIKKNNIIEPTLDEVKSYVRMNRFTFSAEAFFNYYSQKSQPWTDSGGNPLRNWKFTAAKWQKNQKPVTNSSWGRRKSVQDDDEIKVRKIEDEARRAAGFI